MLAVLTPRQLAHSIFPLGGSTKTEVRAEAARRGLAVADKPDSHDVCFIADGDTRRFLASRLGAESGPIVDSSGKVVGSHQGAYAFTVGQRKGLRIGDPAGDGRPRYVLDISPVNNTVTVGTAFEHSHIPLSQWLLALGRLCESRKAVSAYQLHRLVGVSRQSAWLMEQRIRRALAPRPARSPGTRRRAS